MTQKTVFRCAKCGGREIIQTRTQSSSCPVESILKSGGGLVLAESKRKTIKEESTYECYDCHTTLSVKQFEENTHIFDLFEYGSEEWRDALKEVVISTIVPIICCQECQRPVAEGYQCESGCPDTGEEEIDLGEWLEVVRITKQ